MHGMFGSTVFVQQSHRFHKAILTYSRHPYYPLYYVPLDAIKKDMLTKKGSDGEGPSSGILKGEHKTTDQVLIFETGPLSGLVRIEMGALGEFLGILAITFLIPRSCKRWLTGSAILVNDTPLQTMNVSITLVLSRCMV